MRGLRGHFGPGRFWKRSRTAAAPEGELGMGSGNLEAGKPPTERIAWSSLFSLGPKKGHKKLLEMQKVEENSVSGVCRECVGNVSGTCRERVGKCRFASVKSASLLFLRGGKSARRESSGGALQMVGWRFRARRNWRSFLESVADLGSCKPQMSPLDSKRSLTSFLGNTVTTIILDSYTSTLQGSARGPVRIRELLLETLKTVTSLNKEARLLKFPFFLSDNSIGQWTEMLRMLWSQG